MSDLASFLLARIRDDEAVVRDACSDTRIDDEDVLPEHEATWRFDQHGELHGRPLGRTTIALHFARFAEECEAKRRIVELHEPGRWNVNVNSDIPRGAPICETCGDTEWYAVAAPCDTLRALALPYADHPDYRSEWAP